MKLNSIDLKNVIRLIIANNLELGKQGKYTISTGVEGEAGIGKTSSIRQVANELNMPFIKLNLAQATLEDLIGFPIVENMMCKEIDGKEECRWIVKLGVAAYLEDGWHFSGQSRTSYAVPEWLAPYAGTDTPVLLLLDDHNRASSALLAATMEICEEQQYVSWKLPAGSTVITSSNPDDGNYTVSSTDEAEKTRRLMYEMKFDVNVWVNEFAIPEGVDDRAIDFIKIHGTEVIGMGNNTDTNGNRLKKSNIRLWTKYFQLLSVVDNWYEKMDQVILLAGSNFPEQHITLFVNYLKKLYESIPTNEEVMDVTKTMGVIGKMIEKSVKNSGGSIRADIASLFYNRLLTYTLMNCDSFDKKQTDRVRDIILHGVNSHCMHMDLLLVMLKKLTEKQKFLETIIDDAPGDAIRAIFADEPEKKEPAKKAGKAGKEATIVDVTTGDDTGATVQQDAAAAIAAKESSK